MQRLKDGNIITELCKVSGTGQSRRTGTDYCNLVSVLLLCCLWLDAIFSCPVSNKALKLSDGDCLALDAANTLALALALLRTYTSTYCRECGGLGNDLISRLKVVFFYLRDKCRNVDGYRASLYTQRVFTISATGSLCDSLLLVVAITYLFKIRCTDLWLLLTNRNSYHTFHYLSPPHCPHPPWWVAPSS